MATESVVVRKIGISSLGKLVGTVQAVVGLAIGIVAAIVGTVNVVSTSNESLVANILLAIGIVLLSIVVYPLVAFLIGWLYGALVAVVLNVIVGISGGLELTVDSKETASKK